MNKTISINISGIVFNIEEQAYEKLSQYLKNVKSKFSDEAERDEIMADIEARIAELFREKINDSKEVIVDSDVEGVIAVMGKPEDYETEDSEDTSSNSQEESQEQYIGEKKLYRDEDNAMLGGVCAGIAHFFGMDISLIRIIFIILTILGGSGILIYILLLIFVPEAKSTAEKLRMQGQPVTLESIKKHAKDFKNDIKDKANNSQLKDTFRKTVHRGGKVTNTFMRAFSKLFGLGFTLWAIFALFFLIAIFFGKSGIIPIVGSEQIEDLPTLISLLYPGNFQHNIIFIALIIATIIPILGILTIGLKLLFKFKQSFKQIAIGLSVLWVVAIGTLVITGIELGMNFRNEAELEFDYSNLKDSTDILYVDLSTDEIFSDHIQFDDVWNYSELLKVKNDKIYCGYPELRIIEKDDSSNFEIILYKEASGLSMQNAIDNAENIDYQINLKGNHLKLAPYFSTNIENKLRNQRPVVKIYVPQGKKIIFGGNIDRIRTRINQDMSHYCEDSFAIKNTTWIAKNTGLKCKNCQDCEDLTFDEDYYYE